MRVNGHPLFAVTGFVFLYGAVLCAGWKTAALAIRWMRRQSGRRR